MFGVVGLVLLRTMLNGSVPVTDTPSLSPEAVLLTPTGIPTCSACWTRRGAGDSWRAAPGSEVPPDSPPAPSASDEKWTALTMLLAKRPESRTALFSLPDVNIKLNDSGTIFVHDGQKFARGLGFGSSDKEGCNSAFRPSSVQ